MRTFKTILLLTGFALSLQLATAQSTNLLQSIPGKNTKAFQDSEPKLLNTIDYLNNTALNVDKDKRKQQSALLMGWLTNSLTVTVTLNAYIMEYTKKNEDFLMIFLSGWAKYSVENEYSKDELQGNLAGVRAIIAYYQKFINNGGVKKDKAIEALIELEKAGQLETTIKEKIQG